MDDSVWANIGECLVDPREVAERSLMPDKTGGKILGGTGTREGGDLVSPRGEQMEAGQADEARGTCE